jgi:hypothetical protein
MSGTKNKSGGARKGAGRKSADELGVEKKKVYPAYLYPTQAEKIVKKFGSITKAVESLLKKK